MFHTNEGHAGFLGVERIGELVDEGPARFDEALEAVRAGTVFTTHTPGARRHRPLPARAHRRYFGGDGAAVGCRSSASSSSATRTTTAATPVFNMAHMGLRLAQRRNGVAQLHGNVAAGCSPACGRASTRPRCRSAR